MKYLTQKLSVFEVITRNTTTHETPIKSFCTFISIVKFFLYEIYIVRDCGRYKPRIINRNSVHKGNVLPKFVYS